MDILLVGTLSVLGLSTFLIEWKKNSQLSSIFQVLFAATDILWMSLHFNDEAKNAFYALIGITVLGYLIAQFVRSNKWIAALVPLALSLGFFFALGDQTMELDGSTFVPESKFLILGIVIAASGTLIAELKLKILGKWIDLSDQEGWMKALYLFFVGVSAFLGMFAAPGFGLMLIGTTFLIGAFFRKDGSGSVGVSLITLAVIPLLNSELQTDIFLLSADVLEGLFFGAFGMFLISKVWRANKINLIPVIIAYIFGFGLTAAIGYAGSELEFMGGLDAFLAAIVGAALFNVISGNSNAGISYLAPMLAIGLLLPSVLVNEEQEEAQDEIITIGTTTDEEGNEVEGPAVLSLENLDGAYTIITDSSQVQFAVGKNGATKGKFKKVSGSISIAQDMQNSEVSVQLSMKDFTTFNSMRDEHLREDEYFKVSKYPSMSYTGKGFSKKSEGLYEIDGTFKMLGVSQPIKVTIQQVEVEGKIILIGSGTIDRTKFGMTPSAAEGNIVGFNYQVEVLQK